MVLLVIWSLAFSRRKKFEIRHRYFVLKKIKEFKPEFILFSAGFDAHKDDPLAQFKLKSKDENLPDDKKLNFDIWLDPKKGFIVKVSYERLGKWEYILKKVE